MNRNRTNPNERRPKAFFRGAQEPAAAQPAPEEVETPTLPMPGVVEPPQPTAGAEPPLRAPETAEFSGEIGPVVGWLVVLSGSGRGRSFELGYGRNTIGRGRGNDVCLPYGDRGIAEQAHAHVIYDAEGRKAYLVNEHSGNPVSLCGLPVTGTAELQPDNTFRLGNTSIMYVGFCSPKRDWKDIPGNIS